MTQLFIWRFGISRAPLQASTSSSWEEIRKSFEGTKQLLAPRASQDLHVAGAALRAERPKPCQLVPAPRSRRSGEATERAHEVVRLGFAGLPWILAEADANARAVLRGSIERNLSVSPGLARSRAICKSE